MCLSQGWSKAGGQDHRFHGGSMCCLCQRVVKDGSGLIRVPGAQLVCVGGGHKGGGASRVRVMGSQGGHFVLCGTWGIHRVPEGYRVRAVGSREVPMTQGIITVVIFGILITALRHQQPFRTKNALLTYCSNLPVTGQNGLTSP